MSNTTSSKDFTIPIDEGVAVNTELDAQTLLIQSLVDNTKEIKNLKDLTKLMLKELRKINE